jgi:glycosyltransferase involved in cell wall biosynthesis
MTRHRTNGHSKSRPLRIGAIMPLAEQRGGAELLFDEIVRAAPPGRVAWVLFFLEDGPMARGLQDAGYEVHVVAAGRLRDVARFARAVREIARISRASGVDVLLGWMSKAQLYGGAAGLVADIPVVWFQHGLPADVHVLDWLATFVPAAGVLTCSKAGARQQANLWPHRATRVVYPGIDLKRFAPDHLPDSAELRRELGLPSDGPLVGMVGRLQRWKGMHVFVDAMERVLEERPDALGVIVGGRHDLEPDYADYLEGEIHRRGLEKQLLLVGFQTNVPRWLQAMDVFVHASDREPFGMVIVEAMALGKPVVAGAEGGPREIVFSGKNGLLAPYGNDRKLAGHILRYLNDPEYARKIGLKARERAAFFSVERAADRLLHAIEGLIRPRDRERSDLRRAITETEQ